MAMAVWEQQSAICLSLEVFVTEVRNIFEAPVSGREAARKLLQLWQDSLSVADYAADFCMQAAEGAWSPEALFDMFLHGLSDEVKDKLAARNYRQISTHSSL